MCSCPAIAMLLRHSTLLLSALKIKACDVHTLDHLIIILKMLAEPIIIIRLSDLLLGGYHAYKHCVHYLASGYLLLPLLGPFIGFNFVLYYITQK